MKRIIEDVNHDYKLTNREKSMSAKLGLFWCSTCDANKVGKFGRCSVCGKYENKCKKK